MPRTCRTTFPRVLRANRQTPRPSGERQSRLLTLVIGLFTSAPLRFSSAIGECSAAEFTLSRSCQAPGSRSRTKMAADAAGGKYRSTVSKSKDPSGLLISVIRWGRQEAGWGQGSGSPSAAEGRGVGRAPPAGPSLPPGLPSPSPGPVVRRGGP